MIDLVQDNIMNTHMKIKSIILIEIRIYTFILFLMTVTKFLGTTVILKQLNSASSRGNDDKTFLITEYLNGNVPNFNVTNIRTVNNSSIKNDDETILVNEYLNKTIPNFELNVIVPVVNTIIGSHATLI